MKHLPSRLDNYALEAVEAVAALPIPAQVPCDEAHFVKCMRVLEAALPRKNDDAVAGALMANAYRRILGRWPREAIDYLSATALNQCRWFPTIAECNDILAAWKRTDEAYRVIGMARHLSQKERAARMDEDLHALKERSLSQEEVDTLPERTKMIAMERGYLHFAGGTFIIRHEVGSPLRIEPPRRAKEDRPAPDCMECQDVGVVLNLEGEEVACCCSTQHTGE